MAGTLLAALEAREIKLAPDEFVAEVEGTNEMRDGIPVLTKIHVHYRFPVRPEQREAAERALDRHVKKCPTARSLEGAVSITCSADLG